MGPQGPIDMPYQLYFIVWFVFNKLMMECDHEQKS